MGLVSFPSAAFLDKKMETATPSVLISWWNENPFILRNILWERSIASAIPTPLWLLQASLLPSFPCRELASVLLLPCWIWHDRDIAWPGWKNMSLLPTFTLFHRLAHSQCSIQVLPWILLQVLSHRLLHIGRQDVLQIALQVHRNVVPDIHKHLSRKYACSQLRIVRTPCALYESSNSRLEVSLCMCLLKCCLVFVRQEVVSGTAPSTTIKESRIFWAKTFVHETI